MLLILIHSSSRQPAIQHAQPPASAFDFGTFPSAKLRQRSPVIGGEPAHPPGRLPR